MMNPLQSVWLFTILLLIGCASGGPKFSTPTKNQPTPETISKPIPESSSTKIVWGGMITKTENQENSTQLEVIAYPLDYRQRPNLNKPSQGRFIVEKTGYLETADYAPKRLITVQGQIKKAVEGEIGETKYLFPVVQTKNIYLWRRQKSHFRENPQIHFGFGISISN